MLCFRSETKESKIIAVNPPTCRLLYLIGQLHTGGSERQLYYLLRAMDRERYKPAVAVWTYTVKDLYVPQIQALGVPLYSFPDKLSRVGKLTAFRRLVRELQPEVVHSYSFYTNFAARCATHGSAAIPIGSIRSDFSYAKQDSGPVLGRLSARWPSIQISNTSSVAKDVKRCRSFFTPSRLSVVRNGIDLHEFQELPVPDRQPAVIVGVGNLLPVKRWEWLLSAAQELQTKKFDFLVKIVGDGPLRSKLERKRNESGLPNCVEFLGHVDDVPSVLATASFVVHTAISEGSPNSVLEAMACGRAVISTDVGDVSSLIEDGRTGFVVASEDNAALIERMRRLITDRELCKKMGAAGREKVEREFSLDRMVSETLAVYRTAGWNGSTAP